MRTYTQLLKTVMKGREKYDPVYKHIRARMSFHRGLPPVTGAERFLRMLKRIGNRSFRNLMYRAGVVRTSKRAVMQAKAELMDFLAEIMKDAVVYMEGTGRKTVMKQDIDAALARKGLKVYMDRSLA